ncbi:cytochrome c biogenesis protein CcmG, thiol:disulfide interchange protein DsbE [Pseudonocardia ammonioxydans]|uniref:Cytochrome c biogenesis protein CcmG, thiol:disulfide interchange protein DsbE n=1 Tax=Pseudonocardia ammonioxydans TaxID=260086 RepID=A0A1I5HBF1_PSUAM|nr:redoxin domain-containing protein [Pseudonocardia ammonioxydans]SFO45509.1 cytochrome c biogenesis protein CcmG, thiol:disulfide interchange protein DsbE [Pseudonocardia ammonioxydans]
MTARTARWSGVRLAAAIVVVLTIGVGAVFGWRLVGDSTVVDSPLIGRPAPTVVLPELEGDGEVSLTALRGSVVVVNFWASWCVACRDEHPVLVEAARTYRERGVVIVGVDYQDSPASASAFLDELGRGGDNYRYVTDPGSRAALDFGLFGVPETFVLDRSGVIAAKIAGPVSAPMLGGVIEAVLAGAQPGVSAPGAVQPAPDAPYRSPG